MKVIKRDGTKVDFDPVKIEQAVLKASVADEPVRDAINDVVAMCQCEHQQFLLEDNALMPTVCIFHWQ